MKRYLTILGIGVTTCVVAAPPTQMQEGLWEITTRTEILGAAVQAPPATVSACYSKQDVENDNAVTPKDEKCSIQNYRLVGKTASWNITCSVPEKITGTGTITFHSRTAYSGAATLKMHAEGRAPIQMTNIYSGKRLDDCSQ